MQEIKTTEYPYVNTNWLAGDEIHLDNCLDGTEQKGVVVSSDESGIVVSWTYGDHVFYEGNEGYFIKGKMKPYLGVLSTCEEILSTNKDYIKRRKIVEAKAFLESVGEL